MIARASSSPPRQTTAGAMEQQSSEEQPHVDVEDVSEVSVLPTQITSIDGFFNRKRGRPPKNRFVEVYKSAQHSPQAIFTSFKLERSEQANVLGMTATTENGDNPTVPHTHQRGAAAPLNGPFATDLTPSRAKKRSRLWTVEAPRDSGVLAPKIDSKAEPLESRVPAQPVLFTPSTLQAAATSKTLERISVVRAAGTFYPENASSFAALDKSLSSGDCSGEQPEDLSMRTSTQQNDVTGPVTGRGEPEAGIKLLQFKQLLDLYQRQVLLPTFLAAASQPGNSLDMRLLLENAAQQKMLLINAAAAAGAVASATATTAATAATAAAAAAATTATAATASAAFVPPTECGASMGPKRTRTRDQDIPTGYLKFRFNEDCGFERCGYRNHQSHFHCNRRDCHYSFCDKTRFVQHTARHERMDTLMGDDFRQYRANMRCAVLDCCYATPTPEESLSVGAVTKKSSHFHCRKCDYVCTDSNKVVAHRRLHMRLDYVRSAGFRKISSNESCESPTCSYARRHTHYHCTTCDCSVLSRAQLASHRHRHDHAHAHSHGDGDWQALPKQ